MRFFSEAVTLAGSLVDITVEKGEFLVWHGPVLNLWGWRGEEKIDSRNEEEEGRIDWGRGLDKD
jgi:hypothetical protein